MMASATVLAFSGCVTGSPPYEDYTVARTAVRAAQDVDSARYAPGLWAKADEAYRNGEQSYKDSNFESAQSFFKKAIRYSEEAENATRLKKFESGDSFP